MDLKNPVAGKGHPGSVFSMQQINQFVDQLEGLVLLSFFQGMTLIQIPPNVFKFMQYGLFYITGTKSNKQWKLSK